MGRESKAKAHALLGGVEKQAGLGTALLRGAGSVLERTGKGAAGVIGRAWKADKVGTTMGLGGLALIGPTMLRSTPEQAAEVQARAAARRASSAGLNDSFMRNYSMQKSAQVLRGARHLYPQEELQKIASAVGAATKQALDPGKMFLIGAGLALGNQLVGAAAEGAEEGVRRIPEAVRENSRPARWKKVTAYDPGLKTVPHAAEAFAALDRASPYIAGEPLLAASATRQLAAYGSSDEGGPPNIPIDRLKSILDIQRIRAEGRAPRSSRQGAFGALKTPESALLGS